MMAHCLVDDKNHLKLSGFSSAVFVYSESGTEVLLRQRESRSKRNHHLPPECFTHPLHNASHLDVFSCMVVGIVLTTRRYPFAPKAGVRYSSQWAAFRLKHLKGKVDLALMANKAFNGIPYKRPSAVAMLNECYICAPKEVKPATAQSRGSKKSTKSSKSRKNNGSVKSTSSAKAGVSLDKQSDESKFWIEQGIAKPDGMEGGAFSAVLAHTEPYDNVKGLDQQNRDHSTIRAVLLPT